MQIKRIAYFDYLRVLAITSVVVLHVAAQNFNALDGRSFEWNVFNFFDSISRWGVPAFLMISGSLFLTKEVKIKDLYSKYILRLAIACCVWTAFYAIANPSDKLVLNDGIKEFGKIIINNIKDAHHMWFIPMMIGVYMCIPIIKQIVGTKESTKYFLILSFIFAFIIPQSGNLANDFIGGLFSLGINKINAIAINNMKMNLVLGYSFYFILGYYLNNLELTKKQRTVVYCLGAVGFLSTILLNAAVAWKTNKPCQLYYDYFNVNVALEAIAVHTLFKYRNFDNEKLNSFISQLSKYSFGVYLVHVFVIELLKVIGLDTMRFLPIVSVPVISAITLIVSYAISFAINKIPKIGKWIV